MKQKLLLLFTILAMAVSASAYDFMVDGIYYNILSQDDLTCEVTYKDWFNNSYSGDIVLPSTVTYSEKTFSVTSIGNNAFQTCTGLTSMTIPNSVTTIGKSAFWHCNSLTSVTIPNSVTSIGNNAFDYCAELASLTIPNSVTSIGDYAFKECYRLTSVEIPNSVTSIGDAAFRSCTSLTSFIGKFASEDNRCLIVDGELNSFASAGLTSYEIPHSVTSIGNEAFYCCYKLTSVVIPNSITSIGNQAFYNCYKLTSMVIPNSVTSIGDFAFQSCTSLTSVEIGNSVTTIGGGAFCGCSKLASVTIPESVTSIGENAFKDCYRLKSFSGKFASEDNRCLIINGVLSFFAPADLTSYVIPNYVTAIGNSAFEGCSGLKSVKIPNSVTSIGTAAFRGCTSLPVENNLRYADTYLVETVDKPLSTYTIKEGTKWIGSSAFAGCIILTSVDVPNSVISIGDFAFMDCTCLTSMVIPNSVTSIGDYAFMSCYNLISVTISNSVTLIGNAAFQSCKSLTSVVIPSSVTTIGNDAFSYCSGLTSVTIPNSVTSIGDYAFQDCTGLTKVIMQAVTPPTIQPHTFKGVNLSAITRAESTVCTLYVPEEAVEAYKAADYWKDFTNIVGISETGISIPSVSNLSTSGKAYNLSGTEANDGYRGIVIKNGKKFMIK